MHYLYFLYVLAKPHLTVLSMYVCHQCCLKSFRPDLHGKFSFDSYVKWDCVYLSEKLWLCRATYARGDAQESPSTGCGSMQVSGRLRQSPRAHLQWHQACMDRAAGLHRFQGPGKTLAWARGSTESGALGTSQHTMVQLACCKSSEQIRWIYIHSMCWK